MFQLRPNCGGELVARPRRPSEKLARFPASTERVFKPEGCAKVELIGEPATSLLNSDVRPL
jgi:hypothetical protein